MASQSSYWHKIILAVFFSIVLFAPRATFAAMLSIYPESGTYTVGQTFTASVRASSYAQSMNAVSGTLNYPKDVLSVVSVSKSGSVLDTWLPPGATGPVFTQGTGSIHFEGISLSGYKGAPKTVFSVVFKVKQTGTAKLSFATGTILANDGKGTDITNALANASYKLAKAPPATVGQVKPTTPIPSEPVEIAITPTTPTTPESVAPVVAVASSGERSYFGWILAGFGLMMFLIGTLYARVLYLSRLVQNLQSRKRAVSRRKVVTVTKKAPARTTKPVGIVDF